ncbi:MAG: hypothetical protein ACYTGH_09235, partial [Planctomycetota bacterium]
MNAPSETDLRTIERGIKKCMGGQRGRFRRKLKDLRERVRKELPSDRSFHRLQAEIEESIAHRAQRVENRPTIEYPEELPVSGKRDEIVDAIRNHAVVIVAGETGSGKTTQLPKICLEAGRGIDGLI